MDAKKIIRRIAASQEKTDKLCVELKDYLIEKYGREDLFVTVHTDGVTIMFDEGGCNGLLATHFFELAKNPDFDIFEVQTYL